MPTPITYRGGSVTPSRRKGDALDALTLLRLDHKAVADLFERYGISGEDRERKSMIAARICQALTIHAAIEEEIFYPKVREVLEGNDGAQHLLNDAEADHDAIKNLVSDILQEIEGDGASDSTDAHIKELAECVMHHAEEEEGDLFPKVKKSRLDLYALGTEMAERKDDLEEEVG